MIALERISCSRLVRLSTLLPAELPVAVLAAPALGMSPVSAMMRWDASMSLESSLVEMKIWGDRVRSCLERSVVVGRIEEEESKKECCWREGIREEGRQNMGLLKGWSVPVEAD